MDLEIGMILTASELNGFEHLSTFGKYEIYLQNEDILYIFAIDNKKLICSCFEFHNIEDGIQLAHMYTLPEFKGQKIGKEIIKNAVEIWNDFELPSTNNDDNYYYIEDGLGFIRSCFQDGILTEPKFKFPF